MALLDREVVQFAGVLLICFEQGHGGGGKVVITKWWVGCDVRPYLFSSFRSHSEERKICTESERRCSGPGRWRLAPESGVFLTSSSVTLGAEASTPLSEWLVGRRMKKGRRP